jgi:hypothetical protein
MAPRYTVRKQDHEYYCVWDKETDAPAEARGTRYIDLRFDEAIDDAETLNNPE